MDRAYASGAAGSAPTAPASPSIGYPSAGNPATATPATKPGPWWYHMITEEIRNVIAAAGLVPDHTDIAQLSQAVHAIAGNLAKMHGQCRLAKSGSDLVLSPFNGNKLIIGGSVQTVPSAGVSLAATGMTPGSLYYIYAYMNDDIMSLEASTTGHSTDAATGVEIKTGDATRTLVGMAQPITGPAWVDTDTQRYVASWFNRSPRRLRNAFTANRSTSSTTPVELNSEIRCSFLCWGDEAVRSVFGGSFYNSGGAVATMGAIGYDGAVSYDTAYTGTGSTFTLMAVAGHRVLSEGSHFVTALGWASSGTGNYVGSNGNIYNTLECFVG